eukprot:Skav219570  [mRNA]  locus=scaffold3203:28454:28822:- [translate_table: standard]
MFNAQLLHVRVKKSTTAAVTTTNLPADPVVSRAMPHQFHRCDHVSSQHGQPALEGSVVGTGGVMQRYSSENCDNDERNSKNSSENNHHHKHSMGRNHKHDHEHKKVVSKPTTLNPGYLLEKK